MEISFFLGARGPQQQSSTNMGEGPTIPEGLENKATETTQSEIQSEKQSHQMNRAISNTETV